MCGEFTVVLYLTLHLSITQKCKAVYDRIIDLRIATPQIIINFGMFLEENNYFEEAFKVKLPPFPCLSPYTPQSKRTTTLRRPSR